MPSHPAASLIPAIAHIQHRNWKRVEGIHSICSIDKVLPSTQETYDEQPAAIRPTFLKTLRLRGKPIVLSSAARTMIPTAGTAIYFMPAVCPLTLRPRCLHRVALAARISEQTKPMRHKSKRGNIHIRRVNLGIDHREKQSSAGAKLAALRFKPSSGQWRNTQHHPERLLGN